MCAHVWVHSLVRTCTFFGLRSLQNDEISDLCMYVDTEGMHMHAYAHTSIQKCIVSCSLLDHLDGQCHSRNRRKSLTCTFYFSLMNLCDVCHLSYFVL